ncbi:hypothetical protein Scep_002062 [Stephania cephalantha]|uniref:Uncharacterized protein n=1 Tax=Stephania cephalantha TaxID=152367 RepID=A0AAP0Q8E4_9MAGN
MARPYSCQGAALLVPKELAKVRPCSCQGAALLVPKESALLIPRIATVPVPRNVPRSSRASAKAPLCSPPRNVPKNVPRNVPRSNRARAKARAKQSLLRHAVHRAPAADLSMARWSSVPLSLPLVRAIAAAGHSRCRLPGATAPGRLTSCWSVRAACCPHCPSKPRARAVPLLEPRRPQRRRVCSRRSSPLL